MRHAHRTRESRTKGGGVAASGQSPENEGGGLMIRRTAAALALAAGALAVVAGTGCESPLDRSTDDLRRSLAESIRRESAESLRYPQTRETVRADRVRSLELKPSILGELEATSGTGSYKPVEAGDLGEPNLLGAPQNVVTVSLERVVATAALNNLNVQFARLAVAGDEARLVAAQAAFDWVFFTNFQWSSLDQERITTQQFIPPTTRSFDQRQVLDTQAGVRRRLTSGGVLTIQQSLTYTENQTPGLFARPNPGNDAALTLQVDQPLLRNFGSDVALQAVRLAANAERDQIAQLKGELIQAVSDAEQAYWQLVQSAGELQISRRLLERGVKVRDIVEVRVEMDANPAQRANAVATVEARRGDLILAENNLRRASDRLKQIMNDPEMTVGSEVLVLPADQPQDLPIRFSLLDALTTAIGRRPEIQRALLAIDDSTIRRRVAENQILPQLDLRAQARLSALAEGADSAISREAEASLVDFLIGLTFEQPIGNREAEANSRLRRLEQQQAVITYRDVVTRIVVEVKSALRDVVSNHTLIAQRRAARVAAAEDLRTTEVREATLQGLTPEQLDLKLRKQEALAAREAQELGALAGYNVAIARLYQAMGTALERNRIRFEVPGSISEQQMGKPPAPVDPVFGLEPAAPLR